MNKSTEEKALEWFWGEIKDTERQRAMTSGFISLESIVEYYLNRHPWEITERKITDENKDRNADNSTHSDEAFSSQIHDTPYKVRQA